MTEPVANLIVDPEVILRFWFGELDELGRAGQTTQERWWSKDSALDAEVRQRFGSTHAAATRGELDAWLAAPRTRLAYIVVVDQFSRNMFRDTAGMFATDALALRAALTGIDANMHRQLVLDERGMFYMPLMHSEELPIQERCIALFLELANEVSGSARASMLSRVGFAERHRDIVKKFGRFPHRNALLGRASTPDEQDFLNGPGSSF
jgi:uncharacterized protein (DUF924 family)